ncbi:DUF3987 domain-containing protein [Alkalilimnicola ehrlichii]|uniref:DUF3987 domain-containing protein n=1 Tax=Alkalilimnicola ehrlichii TaxID=351052 RepID=UPI003BA1C5B7
MTAEMKMRPESWQAGGRKESNKADCSASDCTTAIPSNAMPYERHIPDAWELPLDLVDMPIWCAWKLVQKPGKPKPDKVPVSAADGLQGSKAWGGKKNPKPEFCTTAEKAIYYANQAKDITGVGIILMPGFGLIGGDLDGCCNSGTGAPTEQARRIIEAADTYTEVSPGLEGYRFIARGTFGGHTGNNRAEGVEFYEDGRFLTITGYHVEGTPHAIEERDLSELGAEYFDKASSDTKAGEVEPETGGGRGLEAFELPPHVRGWITDGVEQGTRSDRIFQCAKDLVRAGATEAEAVAILANPEHGISDKPLQERGGDIQGARQWVQRYAVAPARRDVEAEPDEFDDETGSTEAAGWPEPVGLDVDPPPPLPVEQWPAMLSDYAKAAAASTETPVELPAMLALSVVSSAVQRVLTVEVKPGYQEPCNIFTAVAMPPATRKSAEFKRAVSPLVEWEKRQRDRVEAEAARALAKREVLEARAKELRKKAAKAESDAEAESLAEQVAELEAELPEVPQPPRVWTSDVTTEHLATMMERQQQAMAVLSAEGGIFETMAGRYNQGVANIDLYLQGHAGDAVRVDRGSKPAVLLDNPRLTLGLAVQPDVLSSLSTKPGFRGRGLLGRVLFVLPQSQLGQRSGDGEPMSPFIEASYTQSVEALLEHGQADTETGGSVLRLSESAREAWRQFYRQVEAQLADGGRFEHCRDWAGKLPGAVARIAGLFHAAKYPQNPLQAAISADDMEAAISTGWALSEHALHAYGLMGADPDVEAARRLLRWIIRHGLERFTVRQAHQDHKSVFRRVDDVKPPLAVLVERGYLREVPPEKGKPGRPSPAYDVNPAAHG